MISGPSFLGLNDPPPRKKSSLGLDADSNDAGSSGHLDYLLEDEEEPHGSGAWKFLLIVVALALAVGLGYLRWKNQGFGWLGANKPAAATQPSDASDSNPPAPANDSPSSSSGSSSGSSSNSSPTSSPAPSTPGQPTPSQPAPDSAGSTAGAPANPAANLGDKAAPSGDTNSQPAASTPPVATDKDSDGAPAKAPAAPPIRPKPAAAVLAKPSPARAADPVSEAQRYIYGKGVRQDCDLGLHLLKPAADHANPKAMIEMGALYSAGLCTPRDLPTAYRWFALALRKEPDNVSVQADLQKLWGEMTQPERQLAIRLSQ